LPKKPKQSDLRLKPKKSLESKPVWMQDFMAAITPDPTPTSLAHERFDEEMMQGAFGETENTELNTPMMEEVQCDWRNLQETGAMELGISEETGIMEVELEVKDEPVPQEAVVLNDFFAPSSPETWGQWSHAALSLVEGREEPTLLEPTIMQHTTLQDPELAVEHTILQTPAAAPELTLQSAIPENLQSEDLSVNIYSQDGDSATLELPKEELPKVDILFNLVHGIGLIEDYEVPEQAIPVTVQPATPLIPAKLEEMEVKPKPVDSTSDDHDGDWTPPVKKTTRRRRTLTKRQDAAPSQVLAPAPMRMISSYKNNVGRPARQEPYTVAAKPDTSNLTKEEAQALKYRRMRDLNNIASKNCRQNKKLKQAEKDAEVTRLQQENSALKQKMYKMEQMVARYKDLARKRGIMLPELYL
jgi:hypothetical protein